MKSIQTAIEKATSDTLIRPDLQLNVTASDLINSKPDAPKEAIKHFKKRIISRNPKIQILTANLLDFCMNNCHLPFHTQVSSRYFNSTLENLIKGKDTDPQLKAKLVEMVNEWATRFSDSYDILPGFRELHENLEEMGYSSHQPKQPQKPQQLHKPQGTPKPQRTSGKTLPETRKQKLKKDLSVVTENIQLTNDIIDASSPSEANNETLLELIGTLKAMESKLLKLIPSLEDEELLSICITNKDQIQTTLERHQQLKRGQKPSPLQAAPQAPQEPPLEELLQEPLQVPSQAPSQAPELLDFGPQSNPLMDLDWGQISSEPVKSNPTQQTPGPPVKSNLAQESKEETKQDFQDLLDLF